MGKLIENKKTRNFVLIGLCLAVAAGAAVLLAMSTLYGSSEASAQSSTDEASAVDAAIDSSAEHAEELYSCKADDVNDTATVVKLLETMGLEDITGRYTSVIKKSDGEEVLTIALETSVGVEDKKSLDADMELCSQQILALIPAVDKVQWSYQLDSGEAEDETVTISLDTAAAEEQLGSDVKSFGESAENFQQLLMQQAGVNK